MPQQLGHFPSVGHIQDANNNNGYFFFSPSAMRGFSSRIHNTLYGGCVFVLRTVLIRRGHKEPRGTEFVWQ